MAEEDHREPAEGDEKRGAEDDRDEEGGKRGGERRGPENEARGEECHAGARGGDDGRADPPIPGCAPDEPPRDEGEPRGHHAFREPHGEKRDYVLPVDPLRPDELESRIGEQEGDGGGDRRGKSGQDSAGRLPEPVRESAQRQEPVVPSGDRPPEEADPEGRVLDESVRTGDPRSPKVPADDLQEREHGHADEEGDRDCVLDAVEELCLRPFRGGREIGRRLQRYRDPPFPSR